MSPESQPQHRLSPLSLLHGLCCIPVEAEGSLLSAHFIQVHACDQSKPPGPEACVAAQGLVLRRDPSLVQFSALAVLTFLRIIEQGGPLCLFILSRTLQMIARVLLCGPVGPPAAGKRREWWYMGTRLLANLESGRKVWHRLWPRVYAWLLSKRGR